MHDEWFEKNGEGQNNMTAKSQTEGRGFEGNRVNIIGYTHHHYPEESEIDSRLIYRNCNSGGFHIKLQWGECRILHVCKSTPTTCPATCSMELGLRRRDDVRSLSRWLCSCAHGSLQQRSPILVQSLVVDMTASAADAK